MSMSRKGPESNAETVQSTGAPAARPLPPAVFVVYWFQHPFREVP